MAGKKRLIDGVVTYSKDGQYLWVTTAKEKYLAAQVRGWSYILKQFSDSKKAAIFQDELGQFIADAINEKLERDFNN